MGVPFSQAPAPASPATLGYPSFAGRFSDAEALIAHGVVDHAQAQCASLGVGDRDGVNGDAMDVVDRAVQRVDVPGVVGSTGELTAFLGYDAIAREALADVAEQELLRLPVGFADQVDHALVVDLQVQAEVGAQDVPRLAGEGDEFGEGGRHGYNFNRDGR